MDFLRIDLFRFSLCRQPKLSRTRKSTVAGDTQRDKSLWPSPARLEVQFCASSCELYAMYFYEQLKFGFLLKFRARETEGC